MKGRERKGFGLLIVIVLCASRTYPGLPQLVLVLMGIWGLWPWQRDDEPAD